MKSSQRTLVLVGVVFAVFSSTTARAVNWIGGNNTIYSATAPSGTLGYWDVPGSGAAPPNGVGEVAQKIDNVSGTVTVDVGPVTLGRISMAGTSNNAFGMTPTAGIILDQDGAGPGVATISMTST